MNRAIRNFDAKLTAGTEQSVYDDMYALVADIDGPVFERPQVSSSSLKKTVLRTLIIQQQKMES